jgi:hypothetical protein
MRIEALAHLPEGPPFDEREFRLREVAKRQFPQQVEWRDAAGDFVAAGLDRSFDAQQPGEQEQRQGSSSTPAAAISRVAVRRLLPGTIVKSTVVTFQTRSASAPRWRTARSAAQTTTRKTNTLTEEFAHQSGAAGEAAGRERGMDFE